MGVKNISFLILLALFLIVCIQNVEVVPVHLLFWKVEISKLLLLIITLLIGILVGLFLPALFNKSKKEEQIKVK